MSDLCNAPNCTRPCRGNGNFCNKHRIQIQKYGRLTPEKDKEFVTDVCMFRGCGKAVRALNLCRSHYEQLLAGKRLTAIRKRGKCRIRGCDNTCQSKGLCSTHYGQYRRHDSIKPAKWKGYSHCRFEGCTETAHAKGLCMKHYDQKYSSKSIARSGVKCVVCGETRGTQKCHVIPRREGGKFESNIIHLCPTHHWCFDHGFLRKKEKEAVDAATEKLLRADDGVLQD